MRLSVVLRTYTEARWDYLLAAVVSLREQTRTADELVIVVDHNLKLLDRVRGAVPDAVVVPNDEEAGSSGAWNSGVKSATGDVLAFMDDDATAAPDWLEQLELGYRDPQVMGVGGTIQPVWLDGRPRWFPEEFAWVVGCTYRGLPEEERAVRNLIGCNMSFRSAAFASVGRFLGAEQGIGHVGANPIGCDETEFSIRLRQQQPDKVLLYRPQARVQHKVPASRTSWKYFQSRCYFEGRSKARVAQLVGTKDGLASERTHATRTLPSGVWRGLRDFVVGHDPAGLARAAAIALGLAWAGAGYVAGSVTNRRPAAPRATPPQSTVTGDQLS